MAKVIWFKKSRGLATRYDPTRIEYDKDKGISHLAEAFNVDFDFTGAVSRRLGYEATAITGDCHSFFYGGGDCLFYKDGGISVLAENMTATQIQTGLAPTPISYCQVGDTIAYMNGHQKGVIKNKTHYTYVKPPLNRYPDQSRVYNDPPVGDIVRYYAGRVWIVKDNVLWYSEPFGANLFRLSVNYIPFPGKITLVAPVRGGIFVSTTDKIYFMAGTNPNNMSQNVVANYSAIKGTDVEIDGIALLGGKISPLLMQMFTTTNGICVGTADGQLINLTYETLDYPKANIGNAVYTGGRYIVNLGEGTTKLSLCLSLNAGAPSQYHNFNFSGMCKFGDYIVGGNANYVYKLFTGDNDAGTDIDAHFKTGPTSFDFEHEKRLRRLYLTMRSDGMMKASISGDDKTPVDREITPHDNTLRIIHQEVSGGRDIKGKHLDLKVGNVKGSDFTITEIQAVLVVKGTKTTEVI